MPVSSQSEIEKRLRTAARLTADVKDTAAAVRIIQGQAEPSETGRVVTLAPGRGVTLGERQR